MQIENPTEKRSLREIQLTVDVAVVGGGLAGVCAAITAARAGSKVALIQDRPVLGGNASSEVRMWAVGATSHMGNNNRWAREGGVVGEILVENLHRNQEGSALILDTILLEKVIQEPNVELLLNTAVFEVHKSDPDTIESVRGFCSQNSTMYSVSASVFVDASGDGIVGFQAGAAFRMGAESKDEFDEGFAPSKEYGELLGHTIYFYSKDAGHPVRFTPPSFALKDITEIPRYKNFKAGQDGCSLWWIEYGGRFDTVHDTEKIKWELWSIVYGVWNHIKNSGEFSEAENLVLEWVGTIPGKRESRRFEGDYILSQKDIIQQRKHEDAISYGGWAIDLHPADGVYSDAPGCNQWHSKGIYQIPYRCLYSRNIKNLFLTGRVVSATHVAFGSTRVMLTCGHNGQAVGMAAAMSAKLGVDAKELGSGKMLQQLRSDLDRIGHFIPGVVTDDPLDIACEAEIFSSSNFSLDALAPGDELTDLLNPVGMLIPVRQGKAPKVGIWYWSESDTAIDLQLRTCSRNDGFTPDQILARKTIEVSSTAATAAAKPNTEIVRAESSAQTKTIVKKTISSELKYVEVEFDLKIQEDRYVVFCVLANEHVQIALSEARLTGVLSLTKKVNRRVSTNNGQNPPADIGVDSFEFWLPERRPRGKNLAFSFKPPIEMSSNANLVKGPDRPASCSNAWIADADDHSPYLDFKWSDEKRVRKIQVSLDTDFDHPMETVLMRHSETEIPFCVPEIKVYDSAMNLIGHVENNHCSHVVFEFEDFATRSLRLEFSKRHAHVPVSVFRVRIYE